LGFAQVGPNRLTRLTSAHQKALADKTGTILPNMTEHPEVAFQGTVTWVADVGGGLRSPTPPTLPARWKLVRRLGTGGQGEVWEAEDLELGQRAAVKVFRETLATAARERMRREVRFGRTLAHAELVRVFELIESGPTLAAAMELVEGESLGQLLAREEKLGIVQVVEITRQLLETLSYVHARDVVHRDIKPSNILVDRHGRVRLVDLGLARRLAEGVEVTVTAAPVGTPSYMSPEQIRGEPATAASDLYALGVTIYHMLTGQPPFRCDAAFAVANRHLTEVPQDPRALRPDCPQWLARFVLRLLEKRPVDRFASAAQGLSALAHETVPHSPRVLRRLATAGVLILAALVVAAAAVHLARQPGRRPAVLVERAGRTVRGLDAGGQETWRVALAQPVQHFFRTDFEGDGREETVVGTWPTQLESPGEGIDSEVVILRDDGLVVASLKPRQRLGESWGYPYPPNLGADFDAVDIDVDGLQEVVACCYHRLFYPTAVFVFWPRVGGWQNLLLHSGHLLSRMIPAPQAAPGVLLAGVNNRLGFLTVVGVLEVSPPRTRRELEARGFLVSPEVLIGDSQPVTYVWYTLLPEGYPTGAPVVQADGTVTIPGSWGTARLDRWGNPVGGANAGRDLRAQRMAFLQGLRTFRSDGGVVSRRGIQEFIAKYRGEAAPLLAEAPYRAALARFAASALARVGDQNGAIELLADTYRAIPYEDLGYRLADQQAAAGRLAEATELLVRLIDHYLTPRRYDALQLLLRLAIEHRDAELVDTVIASLSTNVNGNTDVTPALSGALRTRAALWWDQPGPHEGGGDAHPYEPAGPALVVIAQWRWGRLPQDAAARMRRLAAIPGEGQMEAKIALATALAGEKRFGEALEVLGRAPAELEIESAGSFTAKQLLQLARAVSVSVQAAAGHKRSALEQARRLRPLLRPGLLPAILVDEVLAAQ